MGECHRCGEKDPAKMAALMICYACVSKHYAKKEETRRLNRLEALGKMVEENQTLGFYESAD
jgi:hypothetical protein